MKKQLAVILLILGGAAAIFGVSAANLALFLNMLWIGILAAIIVTSGAAFGIDKLRGIFAERYGISATRFFLCAYAPSVAASAVYFIVVSLLDNAGYFKGFMAGLGEFVIGLSWLITSAAAAVLGFIMLVITSMIGERKEQ